MKKLFEDDPRAEEYDKYGRYLPKSAELVRQSTSSLSFVKDHQEGLANEIVKDSYKNDPNKKEERKRRIIARMNCDEYELNGHIFKKGLTSNDKKAIIRKNNLAIKRKRGL
tara:strand:+ start:94 stop:426 length:333 start_codon:yes stop_codon:yes gene_type:complete